MIFWQLYQNHHNQNLKSFNHCNSGKLLSLTSGVHCNTSGLTNQHAVSYFWTKMAFKLIFWTIFISFGSNSEFNSPTYCQPCQKSSKMAWGDKLKFFSFFFQRLSMPRPSVMLNSLFCQFWTNLAIFSLFGLWLCSIQSVLFCYELGYPMYIPVYKREHIIPHI